MFILLKQCAKALWQAILETVFPAFCFGCRKEGAFLCSCCFSTLAVQGEGFKKDVFCSSLDGVYSCFDYEENHLMQKLIHAFKYDFVQDLSVPLGQLLGRGLRTTSVRDAVLCPVPLHPKRLKWRGFNQSALLANVISQEIGLPVSPLLTRIRFQKPQMDLSRAERLENVQRAFALSQDVSSVSHVILVDDVGTTLSTLECCATIL